MDESARQAPVFEAGVRLTLKNPWRPRQSTQVVTVTFLSGLRDRGDETCVVAGFRGSFVICKSDSAPFAFNLQTAIMVKLVARGAR